MIGANIIVTPVIEENRVKVTGYFPSDRWYRYHDGNLEVDNENKNGTLYEIDSQIDFIALHLRGGSIIPIQDSANNTGFSRKTPFGLIISPNSFGEARGDLYYDDGSSEISKNEFYYSTFFFKNRILKMSVEHNSFAGEISSLNLIKIFTNQSQNISIVINKVLIIDQEFIEFEASQIIVKNLNLSMTQNFQIEFKILNCESQTCTTKPLVLPDLYSLIGKNVLKSLLPYLKSSQNSSNILRPIINE